MSIVVFGGPSLDRSDPALQGLDVLSPAAEGDLYRAARQGPRAIALIDGYFEAQPAVWHKEILWAMSRGIHVFGASSMGALRSAELWSFGMMGVGAIFRAYRRGAINDDAEVAVVHGPAEIGFPSLNEALVNVRATLSHARARGILSPAQRRLVFGIAATIFYKERTWEHILAQSVQDGLAAEDASRLKQWLEKNRVDLKRRDASTLVRLLQERAEALQSPMQASFEFETTTFWLDLVDRYEADAESSLKTGS